MAAPARRGASRGSSAAAKATIPQLSWDRVRPAPVVLVSGTETVLADRAIGKAYGVLWPLLGVSQRVTFVIDREGVIRGAFHHEIQATKHIDDALALLERLTPG